MITRAAEPLSKACATRGMRGAALRFRLTIQWHHDGASGTIRASLRLNRYRPGHSMLNIPNLITVVRLALVPVTAWLLWQGLYGPALIVFLAAAVSDFLDGVIARTFNQASALGATLDPIADKLNMFIATVILALHGLLPLWLAIAIVLRDVVILSGAAAYRYAVGHIDIAVTRLSKLNTLMEFGVLLLVMAHAASWFDASPWLPAVFVLVFVTVLASGAQYMWVWGWKAFRNRHAARS